MPKKKTPAPRGPAPAPRGPITAPHTVHFHHFLVDSATVVRAADVLGHRTPAQRVIMRQADFADLWRVHPNGGGLVHVDAHVPDTAIVCIGATVAPEGEEEDGLEAPRIGKWSILEDRCLVMGRLTSYARVRGSAVIRAGGQVRDFAQVGGNAVVGSGAVVAGHVTVTGHTVLGAQALVTGGGILSMLTTQEIQIARLPIGATVLVNCARQIRDYDNFARYEIA